MNRGEYQAYVKSSEWAARRARFKRDHGYHCLACDSSDHIEVHHVRYDNAGAGEEPDRDLRVLCRTHHQLAHQYETSKCYGAYMQDGTLARATAAMISDVRAGIAPAAGAGGARRARTNGSTRPSKRVDSRRPGFRGARRRRRAGGGAWLGAAALVVLIAVAANMNWSTTAPTLQQPAATVTSQQAPVVVPPLPPPPEPYVVQAGDTLEQIARASGVTVDDLLAWNPTIADPDVIDIGQPVITAAPTG